MKVVLLLSGAIASGKSAIAKELAEKHDFHSIGTGKYLVQLCRELGRESTRLALQNLGDELDAQTAYQWPVDVASASIDESPKVHRWLLDSVRKEQQIKNFRIRFGTQILHVHLHSPESVLKARYQARAASSSSHLSGVSYAEAIDHSNEVSARSLEALAEFVYDTANLSTSEIADRILHSMTERQSR